MRKKGKILICWIYFGLNIRADSSCLLKLLCSPMAMTDYLISFILHCNMKESDVKLSIT